MPQARDSSNRLPRSLRVKSIVATIQPLEWMASVDLMWEKCKHIVSTSGSTGWASPTSSRLYPLACPRPQEFSPRLALLIAWLRISGVQLYQYLDDILLLGDSPHEVQQSVRKTLQVLIQAGFIVNLKKSHLNPTQDLV